MAVYTAISLSAFLLPWSVVTASTNMTSNNGYIANGGGSLNFVLPAMYNVGDVFEIIDSSGFGFVILQTMGSAAQQVVDLGLASTLGSTGTTTTTMPGQTIRLVATAANGALQVDDNKGAFIYA